MLHRVVAALPKVVEVVVFGILEVIGSEVAHQLPLVDARVRCVARGGPLVPILARARAVHAAQELGHAATLADPVATLVIVEEREDRWPREVVVGHAGPVLEFDLVGLRVKHLVLELQSLLEELDLGHVLLDLLLEVEDSEFLALGRLGGFCA